MNFAAFLTYTFLTAYTPGPNNIMAMTNASRDGLKRTLPFVGGIFSGFFVVMLGCAIFSSMLYDLIPVIKPVMLSIGAAYLLFLAWSVWRDRPHKSNGGIMRENSFSSGAFLQFVNVKIILYGITALSSYVLPYYKDNGTIVFFALLLTVIAISGCLCWSAFGATMEKLFKQKKGVINVIMAILLVYCAVSLFL